ncbi:hypothetical protein EVAR_36253_1 [Eumeta japonica]|uniref:Uncharacterized protein n=1 Tax=Eumeta variegata TaxID=151549 RepID=A0A4C1WXD3_EUMVA|nr:hypothetical protein EVAR_36253_1 [Eumeta japonica]
MKASEQIDDGASAPAAGATEALFPGSKRVNERMRATREKIAYAVHGHWQSRSHQCVAGLLGRKRISDREGNDEERNDYGSLPRHLIIPRRDYLPKKGLQSPDLLTIALSLDSGINSSQIDNNDKYLLPPVHVERQGYVRVTEAECTGPPVIRPLSNAAPVVIRHAYHC